MLIDKLHTYHRLITLIYVQETYLLARQDDMLLFNSFKVASVVYLLKTKHINVVNTLIIFAALIIISML